MDDTHAMPPHRLPRRLAGTDGYIDVELSNAPVHYHIARCFDGELSTADCQSLAMLSCRIACMAADVIRGRRAASVLQRAMTEPCMRRLRMMAQLIKEHIHTHDDLRAQLCYLPAIPQLLDGMLVNSSTLEMTVHLTIGRVNYWVCLVLKRIGSRWVCTVADIG